MLIHLSNGQLSKNQVSLHLPHPCVRKECDYTPNNSSNVNVHLPDSHIDEEAIGPVSDMSENESQILQVDGNLTISDISDPAITIAAGSMDNGHVDPYSSGQYIRPAIQL